MKVTLYRLLTSLFFLIPLSPSFAEQTSCSLTSHITSLMQAGWPVYEEDILCSQRLIPKLSKFISASPNGAVGKSLQDRLFKEEAGPVCTSLALQQYQSGCDKIEDNERAYDEALIFIDAIRQVNEGHLVTGSIIAPEAHDKKPPAEEPDPHH